MSLFFFFPVGSATGAAARILATGIGMMVAVLPGRGQTVVATLSTGRGAVPVALGVNPATNRVYVANSHANTVTIIDGAENSLKTVAVGRTPVSVAVNPL